MDGAGFGVERPAVLTGHDDEFDAFRKRMMLAYRFRPNPLVNITSCLHSDLMPSEDACAVVITLDW